MPARCGFSLGRIAAALALIGAGTNAGANLVADGVFNAGSTGTSGTPTAAAISAAAMAEGYTTGWSVTYVGKNGKVLGDGQIWFGTDKAGDQFVYYMLPLTYVDNTYGTNASAGWTGGHTFGDLTGSDSMGGNSVMKWTDANAGLGATNTARIDYIAN